MNREGRKDRRGSVPTATALLRTMVCVRCEHYRKTGPRSCAKAVAEITALVNADRDRNGRIVECPAGKW